MIGLIASSAFALQGGIIPYGVGARFAAMGGAGSALVDDSTSAYYNPAGIVKAQAVSLKIGAAAATDGLDKLTSALTSLSDPSKFILDNAANSVNVNGKINAFVGLTVAKIGISVLPIATLNISKPAGVAVGTAQRDPGILKAL